jgi:ribosome maturation factor RimP
MDERKETIEKLENLAKPILQEWNLDLVDIDFSSERGRKLVRLYIDRSEGVNIQDCEKVSREFGELLEAHGELVPGSYNLEVSSPGLDRPFKTTRDYERYLGRLVKVVTKSPIEGNNVFVGLLDDFKTGINGEDSTVVIRASESSPPITLRLSEIAVTRLEVNWDSIFGEKKKPKKRR